jgi:hypothetical protein
LRRRVAQERGGRSLNQVERSFGEVDGEVGEVIRHGPNSFTQRIDRKLRVPFPIVSEPEGTLKRLFGAAFMVPSS